MSPTLIAVSLVLLLAQQRDPAPTDAMTADVERLVRAAGQLTEVWPKQTPPPVPEVASVARHGRGVTPLLLALLSDDPKAERDRKRWQVQQQAALALCRIYSEGEQCGRAYCDGDPPERIGRVKQGWLGVIARDAQMRALSGRELIVRFKEEKVFWRQLALAQAVAASGDRSAIGALEDLLTHEDRHIRGNAAYVLGRLGDPRGFDTIVQILDDRSERPPGQGLVAGRWSMERQIRADHYYAAHLLGHLKDPRGVQVLVTFLNDADADSAVAWSLAEIGDPRAIAPLIQMLEWNAPSSRVLAILALERLKAREALPKLQELLKDNRPSNFGTQISVSEAARRAIAVITAVP